MRCNFFAIGAVALVLAVAACRKEPKTTIIRDGTESPDGAPPSPPSAVTNVPPSTTTVYSSSSDLTTHLMTNSGITNVIGAATNMINSATNTVNSITAPFHEPPDSSISTNIQPSRTGTTEGEP